MIARLLNWTYKRAVVARLGGSDEDCGIPDGGQTQQHFTRALFVTMGRVAKLDGRVSEEEVAFASEIMDRLGLESVQRQQAIEHFYAGKQNRVAVMHCLARLVPYIGAGSQLARLFLKTQCRLAFSKGVIRLKEKILLRDVAEVLGFDKGELLRVYTEIQVIEPPPPRRGRSAELSSAYRLLELDSDADERQIRRAYRRLTARYHPDKLATRQLSASALSQAQDKLLAIRDAYESIINFRRMVGY